MRKALMTTAVGVAMALAAVGVGEAQTSPPPTKSYTTASTKSHTMEGKVTEVDAKRGWVNVKTAEGSMKLHFPPPALDGLKTGNSVTVEIGMDASAKADATNTTTNKKSRQ